MNNLLSMIFLISVCTIAIDVIGAASKNEGKIKITSYCIYSYEKIH